MSVEILMTIVEANSVEDSHLSHSTSNKSPEVRTADDISLNLKEPFPTETRSGRGTGNIGEKSRVSIKFAATEAQGSNRKTKTKARNLSSSQVQVPALVLL